METYSDFKDAQMDVHVCFDKLHDLIQNEEPLTKFEQDTLKMFIDACREVVKLYEDGVVHGIIDENGRLKRETENNK